ncbi:MAG: transposase [Acidobacteriota bacterium]|nr:transposase [Acidobacteriota bacterium]
MAQARSLQEQTQQAARVFSEFSYQTHDSWSCARRVVAKAEHLAPGENPRFLVTSLEAAQFPAQPLYERLYCARGEMENRIKEQFSLFSDRTSTPICAPTKCGCICLRSLTCCWRPCAGWASPERQWPGGLVSDHPAQATQNRRTGAPHRAQSLDLVLQQLSAPGALRARLPANSLLTFCAVPFFDNPFGRQVVRTFRAACLKPSSPPKSPHSATSALRLCCPVSTAAAVVRKSG